MNYASVCAVFFVVVSAVYYYVGGRKHFKGPPVDSDPVREDLLAEEGR